MKQYIVDAFTDTLSAAIRLPFCHAPGCLAKS
jgi:hypothetical protein